MNPGIRQDSTDAPPSKRKRGRHSERAIHDALVLMVADGQTFEIRAPDDPSGETFRHFTSAELKEAARWAATRTARAVYITLNPLRSDIPPEEAAKDKDVVRRCLLLVDADATRPPDTSSTRAEKRAAFKLANKVRRALAALEWTDPIIIDSGNGYHLLYLIDLPNDEDARTLVRSVLKTLATRFDSEAAKVDLKVHNASRITKLPGTMVRKGDDTPDRPHRRSRILRVPAELAITPREMLDALTTGGATRNGHAKSEGFKWRLPVGPSGSNLDPWLRAAVEGEFDRVATSQSGDRNDDLNKAAFALGQLVGARVLARADVENTLTAAAEKCGLSGSEVAKTIRSGLDAGILKPRDLSVVGRKASREHQADDPPPAGESAPADDSTGDDEGIIDLWPKIAPEAFHGIAGELVRLASPHTEADPVAMLVQFLIAFANMLGRGPHFVVGATRHFLNLLAVFVGMTAQGRKGTSWDVSLFMIERIDPLWANDCIQSGLVSGEGLIHHVRDEVRGKPVRAKGKVLVTDGDIEVIDPGVTDKRLLIVETEFSRPLKSINRDTCTLSDVIRQAFDSGNLRNLSKNSPAKATGAHVSIIGHTTQTDIRKFLTATDSMNGFANRFLWVSARRSKILPDGGNMFSVDWAPLRNRLISVAEKAKQITKMGRDEDASQIWRDLYEDLSSPKPGILGAVLSRAEALVMRLACVYALLDGSAVVERPHLLAALAVWDYCESSARFIFGADLGNPKAEKLIEALKEAGDSGLSREQITVDVFQRNLKKEVIDVLLSDLLTLRAVHRLQVKSATGKGRPSVRWYRGMGAPDGSEAGTQ